MSLTTLFAELAQLTARVERGEADGAEVKDAVDRATRAAVAATNVERFELGDRLQALEAAVQVELGRLGEARRVAGRESVALAGYASTLRPSYRGQRVRTKG